MRGPTRLRRAAPAAAMGVGALLGLAAPACTQSTLEFLSCRTDADCAVSLGDDYACSADGYCRTLPETPERCRGVIDVRVLAVTSVAPVKDVGAPYYKGVVDLLRELDRTGGVRGCALTIKGIDTQDDPVVAGQQLDAWAAEPEWSRVTALFGFGAEETRALAARLQMHEVVGIPASYASDLASPRQVDITRPVPGVDAEFKATEENQTKVSSGYPFNFSVGTDPSTVGRAAMEFVEAEDGDKIAFFVCDDDACESPLAAIKSHAFDELELPIGRDLIIESDASQAEVDALVQAYFAEEEAHAASEPGYVVPDWIWVGDTTVGAGKIGAAVGRVRESSGRDIRLIVNSAGFDETLYDVCGSGCVDYVYGVMPFAAWGDEVQGMAELMRIHDEWRERDAEGWGGNDPETNDEGGPREYSNVHYVRGYAAALLWQRAMERLIDYQKPLTGAALRDVLERPTEFDLQGLTSPIRFAPGDHRPNARVNIAKIAPGGTLFVVERGLEVALDDTWLGW